MNKRVRMLLFLVFGAVFLYSAGRVAYSFIGYRQGANTYEQAESLANLPDFSQISLPEHRPEEPQPEEEPPKDPRQVYLDALSAINMEGLREKNSQVLGWILIPGTTISYPLLYGSDNSYYLNHAWDKSYSFVGSIFLDYRNSSDWSDFNTIIYGHNMRDSSMFATLQAYTDPAYFQDHPLIYITDGQTVRQYNIFAAYEVYEEGLTYTRQFDSPEEKQQFIDTSLKQSYYNTGVQPTVEDHIITLSTCTGRGSKSRWIVQAVLAPEEEPPAEGEEPPAEGEEKTPVQP